METDLPFDNNRDAIILQKIERDPDATQVSLAEQMGVAVGTINWHLKRLIEKGYIKVKRAERRKLRYIITPEGITLRAHMTVDYIQNSFRLYRLARQRSLDAIEQVRLAGHNAVRIEGDGDVTEVCRLTCMEQGISIVNWFHAPLLHIRDMKVFVEIEENL